MKEITEALFQRVGAQLAPGGMLSRAFVPQAATALENPARAGRFSSSCLVFEDQRGCTCLVEYCVGEVSDAGTGWPIASAFEKSELPSATCAPSEKLISVHEFAEWWAAEDVAARAADQFCRVIFPGSVMLERQGTQLRFKIAPQASVSTGGLFGLVEQVGAIVVISACVEH